MYRWFEKDGHVFSEETKVVKNQDFRLGNTYVHQVAIAYNLGKKVARRIVDDHNKMLEEHSSVAERSQ